MKTFATRFAAVLTVCGLFIGSQSAASAHGGYGNGGYGHGGHGHGGGYGSGGGYGHGNGYGNGGGYGYGTGYGGGAWSGSVGPVWHNTTHWDYHPAQVVPHGNHSHYIPGHYDLHRTGHFHY